MQKLKRILALAGAVLLIGMYLITLILGLTASPATQDMLMAAIVCTVVIPCLLYAFMLVARVLDNRGHSDSQSKADRQKSLAGSAKDGSAKER